jgi:hypothetical protein
LKYERRVKPSVVLPPDLIRGYYERDPVALEGVRSWLDKNGLTILFTLEEAYGDESVYLGDDFYIYIGTPRPPKKHWMLKLLRKHNPNQLSQAIKENWPASQIHNFLKKRSEDQVQ